MGRYRELAQAAREFLQSTFNPVYLEGHISEMGDIEKKVHLDNNVSKLNVCGGLSMVSWNIFRGYHKSKIRASLKKIMHEHNPGMILVQEAPVYESGVFWDDPIFAGFNTYYAPLHQVKKPTSFYNFSHSGQLALSRYPFTKTAVYPLPSVARQFMGRGHVIKRLALYTQILTDSGKSIGIYNIHLENAAWPSGRIKQLRFLQKIIDHNNDDCVVIGGDFNTFLGGFEQVNAILKKFGFSKLFSGKRWLPRLDHFFVKGARATGVQLRGSGSDHQPVMVRLSL
ncbi:endonuclease/exonuclease/phosphatase family protein [Patescibacteria group bacterium]|nr:endonuclease/exonuclease/phosphatase family protein [Patescibacteria group bacterium]